MSKLIGFIGQGYIGKNYADAVEERGYAIIRYGQEDEYVGNKARIKDCDIVFIAVPTPTTPQGFDGSIVEEVLKLVGKGKTAVIKSTITPGLTKKFQADNPDIFVMHSPEFLCEKTAREEAKNPNRNIVGIPEENQEFKQRAQEILEVLPLAPYSLICKAEEAEMIKYINNCFFYFKVVFMNLAYDLVEKNNGDWSVIKEAMEAEPMISNYHLDPVHKNGRGAGGSCLIKDFAAFKEFYEKMIQEEKGLKVLESIEEKNLELLKNSNKNIDILKGIYGDDCIC